MKPLTLEEAKQLSYGEHIYAINQYNKSGHIRVKVNGKPKTWKTRPNEIMIPVKYGLYQYFYINQYDLKEWSKDEQ